MDRERYYWEQESVDDKCGGSFKVNGRKFKIINASGQELVLEIGEEFWIVDEATGTNGTNVFFLQQDFDEKPHDWSPVLTAHLTADEDVKEYAEEHCWGNLNSDEQRMMAECPVVEHFAGSGMSSDGFVMCPRCKRT